MLVNQEVGLTFLEEPTTPDRLKVVKTIGTGKFTVYQAHSATYNTEFALKIFPSDEFGTSQYHKEKLSFHLNHPNVIKNIPIKLHDGRYHGLLTEYAKFGTFFEFVTGGALHSDVVIRTYFHQLIDGLEHIHSHGVAHLDLKLQNMLLGSDMQVKIIDFDQAQPLADKLVTSGGTKNYRAPEVRTGSCTNLAAADMYSVGVILYTMKAQEYPYVEMSDPEAKDLNSYSTFVRNNRAFWNSKVTTKRKEGFFNKEFIELVNGLLHPNPEKRFTLKHVKASKWFNGPILPYQNEDRNGAQ